MNKLNLLPKTRKAGVITLAVVGGLVVGGLGVTRSEAAMDWLGLEQKLTNHDEQLDNHDDRITNVEKDVEKVQKETNVAPSPEKVIVREVQTSNPAVTNTPEPEEEPTTAPTPNPVTITNAQVIQNGVEYNCKFTYSDGTTKTFRWKWELSPGATHTSGPCDDTVVGMEKKEF